MQNNSISNAQLLNNINHTYNNLIQSYTNFSNNVFQFLNTTDEGITNTPISRQNPIQQRTNIQHNRPIHFSSQIRVIPNNVFGQNPLNPNNQVTSQQFMNDLNALSQQIQQESLNAFTSIFGGAIDTNTTNNQNIQLQPLTDEIIQRETSLSIYDSSNTNIDNVCPISLAPFNNGDEIMTINYCRHSFLKENIMYWFSRNTSCPLCRYNLLTGSSTRTSTNRVQNTTNQTTTTTPSNQNIRITTNIPNLPMSGIDTLVNILNDTLFNGNNTNNINSNTNNDINSNTNNINENVQQPLYSTVDDISETEQQDGDSAD